MEEFQKKVAEVTMKNSVASFVILMLITAFFAVGIQRVDIRTIFSDLFPKNHPFVETFKDHPNFGNPLTVVMMVKVKNGDIYNPETLEKIWRKIREIDLAPAVDHDQILLSPQRRPVILKRRRLVLIPVRSWATVHRRPKRNARV